LAVYRKGCVVATLRAFFNNIIRFKIYLSCHRLEIFCISTLTFKPMCI
jgi:hypothetical protein